MKQKQTAINLAHHMYKLPLASANGRIKKWEMALAERRVGRQGFR